MTSDERLKQLAAARAARGTVANRQRRLESQPQKPIPVSSVVVEGYCRNRPPTARQIEAHAFCLKSDLERSPCPGHHV